MGRRKKWKLFTGLALGISLALLLVWLAVSLQRPQLTEEMIFVQNLGAGWNLGNTLDAHGLDWESGNPADYETFWGNPRTTREMIEAVQAAGFETIRIPVTWYEHMDGDFNIDAAWMDRVNQVVDYAIDSGLFVILNAHHDDSWYGPSAENLPRAERALAAVWTQIAERFADYGEQLLFEGMNEPRLVGAPEEWGAGTPEARAAVNRLNQVFVDTVRAGPGNNPDRYLLVPTYCASTERAAMEDFRLPAGERLIVSMHLYAPYPFTLDEGAAGTDRWSRENSADTHAIDRAFENMARVFLRRGIPVILTEYGAMDKNNTESRVDWAGYVLDRAATLGVPCLWWDNSILDREALTWRHPALVETLVRPRGE